MVVVIHPHSFCEELSYMRSDWLDLPKLTTLTSDNGNSYTETFEYPRHIILESDSHLTAIITRYASSQQRLPESQLCIPLQEWRYNPRKYSLHSFLTNRHRSSSTLFQLNFETCMISSSVCSIHNALVRQKITKTHSVVSDPNERRALFILSYNSELIIGLEAIHVFNTLFNYVEKNRTSFWGG